VLTRVRSQAGFTLVEMLVAIVIGSIVTLAAFTMLDRSVVLTGKTTDRVDSTQRGRVALDVITRHLRSQVCPAAASAPIESGGPRTITFWAFFRTKPFAPQRYTIAWDPNTQSINETIDNGQGTPVVSRRTLISGARTPTPLFTYYAYPTDSTSYVEPSVDLLGATGTALSADDAKRVAMVEVHFTAVPSRAANSATTPQESTEYDDKVYSRTADPNATAGARNPTC
jgi:prepilin-type N-terminal cleavage/methylation domain-containing protein